MFSKRHRLLPGALRWTAAVLITTVAASSGSVFAATCPPVVTAESGDASAFASYWASQPVKPGQTVSVSGGGTAFGPGMSVEVARLPDCDAGDPNAVQPVELVWKPAASSQATGSSALFAVPPGLQQGAFAYRFSRDGKVGPRVYVNRPDISFVSGNDGTSATQGGYIQVHGVALDVKGKSSPARLALVRNGVTVAYLSTRSNEVVGLDGQAQTVRTKPWKTYRIQDPRGTLNNGYRKRFYVPDDVPVGEYEVRFHPGYGGPEAWVRYASIGVDGRTLSTIRITNAPRDILAAKLPVLLMSSDRKRSADDRLAEVLATARSGGGIVVVPAGTHELTRPIVLPANTVLRGINGRVTLHFAAEIVGPGGPEDYATLITGEKIGRSPPANFSVFGLKIVTESNRNPCIGVDGTNLPVKIWGVTCLLKDTLPEPNLTPKTAPWGYAGALPGIWIRNASNVDVFNSTVRAPQPIYTQYSSYVTVESTKLIWRLQHTMIEGTASAYVFENDLFSYDGKIGDEYNTMPGVEQALYLQSRFANQRYIYIGRNTLTSAVRQVPNTQIGSVRFDTAFGTHIGRISAVDPSSGQLTLADPISNLKAYYAARPGDMVLIVSGKGEGQYRVVTARANGGTRTVKVDRPWDVQPDATSVVHIRNFQGNYLFVHNDAPFDGRWSDYFTSNELTIAENRLGAVSRALVQFEFLNKHYWGPAPALGLALRNQYLGNTFVNAGFSLLGDASSASPYPGLVNVAKKNTIFRGNKTRRNANGTMPSFMLTVLSRGVDGLVVEDNTGLTRLRVTGPAWGAPGNGVFRRNMTTSGDGAHSPWSDTPP